MAAVQPGALAPGPDVTNKQTTTTTTTTILLLTATELLLGGSSPYTRTDKTNKNKYTQKKLQKNTIQTTQNTVNTSTYIVQG
jgi:hypothetical protein